MAYSRPRPGTAQTPVASTSPTSSVISALENIPGIGNLVGLFTGGPQKGTATSVVQQGVSQLPVISQFTSVEQSAEQAITDATDFLKLASWLFLPLNWLRAVEFLTGMWLMVFGMRISMRNLQGRPLRSGALSRRMLRQTPLGRGPLRHVTRTRNRSRSNSSENSSE